MKFFRSFPKIISNNEVLTNLLVRTDLLPSLLNNSSLFYKYEIQDGDNPEIMASKYYNDPYRYWLFLYSNNIMDPIWDLPLSTRNFDIYLESKYKDIATENDKTVLEYTQTNIKYYYKTITTIDSYSKTTSIDDYQIDYETYLVLPESQSFTITLDDGQTSTLITSKWQQNIYDHELQLNENKRSINVMNSKYTKDMENQLVSLLQV
jgi:hypothetical protein